MPVPGNQLTIRNEFVGVDDWSYDIYDYHRDPANLPVDPTAGYFQDTLRLTFAQNRVWMTSNSSPGLSGGTQGTLVKLNPLSGDIEGTSLTPSTVFVGGGSSTYSPVPSIAPVEAAGFMFYPTRPDAVNVGLVRVDTATMNGTFLNLRQDPIYGGPTIGWPRTIATLVYDGQYLWMDAVPDAGPGNVVITDPVTHSIVQILDRPAGTAGPQAAFDGYVCGTRIVYSGGTYQTYIDFWDTTTFTVVGSTAAFHSTSNPFFSRILGAFNGELHVVCADYDPLISGFARVYRFSSLTPGGSPASSIAFVPPVSVQAAGLRQLIGYDDTDFATLTAGQYRLLCVRGGPTYQQAIDSHIYDGTSSRTLDAQRIGGFLWDTPDLVGQVTVPEWTPPVYTGASRPNMISLASSPNAVHIGGGTVWLVDGLDRRLAVQPRSQIVVLNYTVPSVGGWSVGVLEF